MPPAPLLEPQGRGRVAAGARGETLRAMSSQGSAPPLLRVAFSAWGRRGVSPQALNPKAGSLRPPALRLGDDRGPQAPAATVPQARALHVSVSASTRTHGFPLIHESGVGVLAPCSAPLLFPLLTSLQEKAWRLLLLERKGLQAQSPLPAASPSPSSSCRKTPPPPAPGVGLSLTPVAPAPEGTVTLSTSSEHQPPAREPTAEASQPGVPEAPI